MPTGSVDKATRAKPTTMRQEIARRTVENFFMMVTLSEPEGFFCGMSDRTAAGKS